MRYIKALLGVLLVILGALSFASGQKAPTNKPSANKRLITFAGLNWEVKTSPRPVGPGPNLFSDSSKNVWVDQKGMLHLRITKEDGRYLCAEVICTKSFGYGNYRFEVEAVKNLGASVVGGLFTWDNTDPAFSHREIDFEYSHWLNLKMPNFQAVVQPYQQTGRVKRYNVPIDRPTTHEFDWRPTKIAFRSFDPAVSTTKPFLNWTFSGSNIPRPGREQVRINLWLFNGIAPKSGGDPEIVISRFQFKAK